MKLICFVYLIGTVHTRLKLARTQLLDILILAFTFGKVLGIGAGFVVGLLAALVTLVPFVFICVV